MANAGLALDDNSNEELMSYDLIAKIGDRLRATGQDDLSMRTRVASALVSKGFTLGTLNRSEDAIAVYDEVVKRFGEATEPALCELVGRAKKLRGNSE